MKTWYVELRKVIPTTYSNTVRAETQEEAENEVIMWAGGVPEDWEVTDAFEKTEFASDHGGIM